GLSRAACRSAPDRSGRADHPGRGGTELSLWPYRRQSALAADLRLRRRPPRLCRLPARHRAGRDAADLRARIGRRAADRQQPHSPEHPDRGPPVRRGRAAPWQRRPAADRQDRAHRAKAGGRRAVRQRHRRIVVMTDTSPTTDAAAPMRLRAEPPRVTRLSRKMLAGVGAVALLGIGGALIYALQTRDAEPGGEELYSTENRPTADGLRELPTDYTGPILGPALPG